MSILAGSPEAKSEVRTKVQRIRVTFMEDDISVHSSLSSPGAKNQAFLRELFLLKMYKIGQNEEENYL